ncbi:MAG: SUF system Fe-S cluster assembly regulator [Burkholderiales bacterium]|nr:SUF system Fe-S cluster assembly regulator [Burkholderiales bacterium]OJX05084.1 MAG: SUF system Fe-S cluster assembly regulator [Burkholderiales bacterium 70-64]
MLRISRLADYGTMVMTQMASQPQRLFSAADLALSLGLGRATVSKVLKSLARRELVASVRGLHGGYSLSRPPQEITVADIVDALEEQPFGLTECSATSGLCDIETSCRVRTNWQQISLIVRRALEGVTLADMAPPLREQPIVLHRAPRAAAQASESTQ